MRHIDPEIRNSIEERLKTIEQDFNVEILLAVESGSRAWGFESVDSDYDVRFVYKHELKWYLNVLPKRDVIELPIVGIDDYSGWDVRKALFLLNKSNPVLFEWLRSPIVYKENRILTDMLREASKQYFSPISSTYHYLHMAAGNYREYLRSEFVKVKKYFYVLRPLMACMWIQDKKESPPVEFEMLVNGVDISSELRRTIFELMERKKSGVELGEEKSIKVINDFVEEKIAHFETHTAGFDPRDKPSAAYLDETLWDIVSFVGTT